VAVDVALEVDVACALEKTLVDGARAEDLADES